MAFLQSGRYDDNVRLIREEEDDAGQSLHLNRSLESNSDSEGWSYRESESDSSNDDEESRPMPPLTDSEDSEQDEESEDSDKDNKTMTDYKRRKLTEGDILEEVSYKRQEIKRKTSPQAKRHKPSLLFTSLTILTFITR